METDWSLVGRVASGEPEAQERWAREHLDLVRSFCRRALGAGERGIAVDDLVQDVFFECMRPEGALKGLVQRGETGSADGTVSADSGNASGAVGSEADRPRLRAWLSGIARKVLARHRERARRDAPVASPSAWDPVAADTAASKLFDRVWAEDRLAKAAASMAAAAGDPDARRRVELLRLRFGDGLPVRRIAALWGEDPAKVHRWYAAAREEYKHALRQVVRADTGLEGEALDARCRDLVGLL